MLIDRPFIYSTSLLKFANNVKNLNGAIQKLLLLLVIFVLFVYLRCPFKTKRSLAVLSFVKNRNKGIFMITLIIQENFKVTRIQNVVI